MLVNVYNEQITTFENIPLLRREVVVHGDGKYFYRAVALWKDEISDEKHEEIPRSSDSLFEKNPKVFQLQLFFSNSLKDLVRKSKITGTPAETVDISSVVHHSLRDRFVSLIVTEERVHIIWAAAHKHTLPEIKHKARKKIIKTKMCLDKAVVDTLLEVEILQISWAYGTRTVGSPCWNAGYHAWRPENCVALCWNCWRLFDSFLKSSKEQCFAYQHLHQKCLPTYWMVLMTLRVTWCQSSVSL